MIISRVFLLTLMVAGAATLVGCKTGPRFEARPPVLTEGGTRVTVTNQLDPAFLKPDSALYSLGPGDVIEAEIDGDALSRVSLTVGPDGRVYFDILNGLEVWGLTLGETKAKLETELRKLITQASVNVSLRSVGSKYMWLLGRMTKPGLYPMSGPTRLLEALAVAGGTESYRATGNTQKYADLQRSFVMRQGQLVPVDFRALLEHGDMSQNIYLRPDDFVYFATAQAEEVYILGAVPSPHPVPFKEDMTLVSALSSAGGTLPDAYESHIVIVRGSLTTPEIAKVDFHAIRKGLEKDIRLQPRDIIFVPWEPWRDAKQIVRRLMGTFVSAVAANEGARLVDPNAAPLGISAGVGGIGTGGGGGGGGR